MLTLSADIRGEEVGWAYGEVLNKLIVLFEADLDGT